MPKLLLQSLIFLLIANSTWAQAIHGRSCLKVFQSILFRLLLPSMALIVGFKTAHAREPGQCSAILASKTYSPSSDKNLIFYSCTYECANSSGQIEKVVAKHTFDRRTQNEMFDLVCEAVRIGKVINNGMTIYAPIGVDTFWALLSQTQEMQTWAKNTGNFPSETFIQEQKLELTKKIVSIESSYSQIDSAKFPEFQEASALLSNELSCWQNTGLMMTCPLFQTAAKLSPSEMKKEKGALALALQQIQAHGKILFQLSFAGIKL